MTWVSPTVRAFDLAVAGLAAEVGRDLVEVGHAGRAERVTLRDQAAADVDRDLPVTPRARARR